jgi:glycosyltransferase involved in cell wall biosynthesis
MPEQARELKEKLGIKGPILYYVGRLAFYKGIDNIIEAFYKVREHIPDINLLIGGKPEIKLVDTVEKWKKEYPEVRFLGPIADEEMPVYYSMADAFVTYSFAAEGFGLTPVEALACGTPIICSTMPAYQEILREHAIFVEPKRSDLLAEKIIEFFKNPDLRKQIMKNADEFLQRYTWKAFGDQIEAIYSDFLET